MSVSLSKEELLQGLEALVQRAMEKEKIPADTDKPQDLTKIASFRQKYDLQQLVTKTASTAAKVRLGHTAVKYRHPDAGLSYTARIEELRTDLDWVCSATVPDLALDTFGNAAAAPFADFAQICLQGKPLYVWAQQEPQALAAILEGTAEERQQGVAALARLVEEVPASHSYTAQVYFPVDAAAEDYHLLHVQYPSSLAAHTRAQLGEAFQASFEARKQSETYATFPGVGVVPYGGSKPQNISRLNSNNRGGTWLLASVPPAIERRSLPAIWGRKTMFTHAFGKQVEAQLQALRQASPGAEAEEVVQGVVQKWVEYLTDYRWSKPDWVQHPRCKLTSSYVLLLGEVPQAVTDLSVEWRELPQRVGKDFASWLGQRLGLQADTDRKGLVDLMAQAVKDYLL